jgi:hypothetical protein
MDQFSPQIVYRPIQNFATHQSRLRIVAVGVKLQRGEAGDLIDNTVAASVCIFKLTFDPSRLMVIYEPHDLQDKVHFHDDVRACGTI